jgi:hypothetical protein
MKLKNEFNNTRLQIKKVKDQKKYVDLRIFL